MIAVSDDLLRQVEYLINQSLQGHHVLFDLALLKRVMKNPFEEPFSEEDAYEVEPHLEKIIELPSLERKRAYIEKLDKKTLEKVIRTYFNLVENNLYERKNRLKH